MHKLIPTYACEIVDEAINIIDGKPGIPYIAEKKWNKLAMYINEKL
jgi:hypothetical protein